MPADPRPCKVCLIAHDEEIHAATLSVRAWFRDQVTQGFFEGFEEPAAPAEVRVETQVA